MLFDYSSAASPFCYFRRFTLMMRLRYAAAYAMFRFVAMPCFADVDAFSPCAAILLMLPRCHCVERAMLADMALFYVDARYALFAHAGFCYYAMLLMRFSFAAYAARYAMLPAAMIDARAMPRHCCLLDAISLCHALAR